MEFGRVTPAIVDELRDSVGADVVSTDPQVLERHASDETEDFRFLPHAVVFPRRPEDVQAVLRIAHRERIPVTPRSGGTSLSGGALPVHGGIVLAFERMDRIIEIDTENLFAVVEPGVITQRLQEEVERHGLYYPPDPASRASCRIGGNVAHNAGGPHAVKYGVTRDYVYGIDAVLADGTLVSWGGKLLKNVAGYDLARLFVGSEGTLAVAVRVVLRLIPFPRHRRTLIAPFPDVRAAASAVPRIFQRGIVPACCEFMERAAVAAAEAHLGVAFPHGEAPALLLLEADGNDADVVERQIGQIAEVCLECGAPDVFLADDESKRQRLWALRRSIGEAVRSISPYREEDTVVPRSRLPELMEAIASVCAAHGLRAISYGHIGDGNVHVNLLRMALPREEWERRLPAAVEDLFRRVRALGGQITGEHGVGWIQRNYMGIAHSRETLAAMRAIKRALDPHGILNPSKVLPDEDPLAARDAILYMPQRPC